MTSSQQAYHYILSMVNNADNYFAFRCIDLALEEYKACFPELRAMRSELIDARHDKWSEMRKPNIQIKNQNNEP